MSIPLESNPGVSALVGYIAGHSSLMSALFVAMFRCMTPASDVSSFSKAPANQKRKRLKACAKEVLKPHLLLKLIDFLDRTAAPLEKLRGDLMHDLWASGADDNLILLPSFHKAETGAVHEPMSEETLSQILLRYKNANRCALELLSEMNQEIYGSRSGST